MEFEIIRDIIVDILNIDPETITMDTRFVDDLGADSLDLFQVVLKLEEKFEITINDSQMENIQTVGDAVEAIKKSVNG